VPDTDFGRTAPTSESATEASNPATEAELLQAVTSIPGADRSTSSAETALPEAVTAATRTISQFVKDQYGAGDFAWYFGHCNICGADTVFTHLTERSLRESFVCASCYSTARYRAVARAVLRAIAEQTGSVAESIAELPRTSNVALRVLDTQVPFSWPPFSGYQLPAQLAKFDWIQVETMQFKPQLPWGASIGEQRTNQNLEHLTYADSSFDIVLTSDVMEHVRLYEKAHAEIHRILRPGGFYIFTVPSSRAQYDHTIRVEVHDPDDPSRDEHLLPPEYHGSADPDEQAGVLSYRSFGVAIDDELGRLGFSVNYANNPEPRAGLFGAEVFVCRRL
jgi:SAM-dependent methyltransferase